MTWIRMPNGEPEVAALQREQVAAADSGPYADRP